MGAVALVALIAGGPLGMCLALAYGVVTLTKIAKVDAQYAKNGQPPASAQLIQRWLDRRAAKGAKPEKIKPYGSWAYAKQRWLAMWQDLGEKHTEVRNAYKAAVADAKATGRPLPPKPKQGDYLKGWQWEITPVGEARNSVQEPAGTESPGATTQEAGQTPAPEPHGRATFREQAKDVKRDVLDEVDDARKAWRAAGAAGKSTATAAPDDPSRAQAEPGHGGFPATCRQCGDAYLSPFDPARNAATYCPECSRFEPGTTKGDDVSTSTQQSGEVTGIRSAIHYLTAMATAHAQHADNEALVAALSRMRVGPGDIARVQAAMDASAQAAELYAGAADLLARNNAAVAEAYGSHTEAADKQAQMAE
jgi:hypothetical protein